jgi:hypothetical protein
LTSPLTNISGVYEISLDRICFDTNLAPALVEKILDKFKKDKKITYKEEWLVIHNFIKNQSLNPKIVAGMKIALQTAPIWAVNLVKADRLFIGEDRLSHSNPNSKSNSNYTHDKKILADKLTLK